MEEPEHLRRQLNEALDRISRLEYVVAALVTEGTLGRSAAWNRDALTRADSLVADIRWQSDK